MTEEKLLSVLELEEDEVYINTVNDLEYKIQDKTLFYNYKNVMGLHAWIENQALFQLNEKIFREVKQKKKITMYRLTIESETCRSGIFQTEWNTDLEFLKEKNDDCKILKTETKEIEIDE